MSLLAPASHVVRFLGLGVLLAMASGAVVAALTPAAHAAESVPVLLPSGQHVDDWASALASRGFVITKGPLLAEGPSVQVVDRKDYWELIVRDWKGNLQSVNVAPCTSPGERDDLLFLLTTLMGAAPEPATPAVVAPPPPAIIPSGPVSSAVPGASGGAAGASGGAGAAGASKTAPATASATPGASGASGASKTPPATASATPGASGASGASKTPPATASATPSASGASGASKTPPATASATPATTATPAATTPAKSTPAVTTGASGSSTPVATTTPRPAPSGGGTGLWLGVGGGVGVRAQAGVVGDFRLDGGWHVAPSVRIGVGLAGRTSAALAAAGDGNTMSDLDIVAEAAWVAPMTVAPVVGLYGGVASRSFTRDGEPLVSAVLPILGGELGVQIPLGSLPLHLEPSVRLQGDLRQVQLLSELGEAFLAPLEVRGGLVIAYRAR